MSPELEKKLIENFDRLFQDRDKDLQTSLMSFGCCCDDGWYNLIYDALMFLDKFPIKLVQVKEKLGSLVIYWDFEDENYIDNDGLTEKIENILKQISDQSLRTCEICGENGSLGVKHNWFKTMCYNCRKKEVKWHSPEIAQYHDKKIFYETLSERLEEE